MARKSDLPEVPAMLADVALIDGPTCAAAGGISLSQWLDQVRTGTAPQPAIRAPRCTRWRLVDVRQHLIDLAATPIAGVSEAVVEKASKASRTAREKRLATSVRPAMET